MIATFNSKLDLKGKNLSFYVISLMKHRWDHRGHEHTNINLIVQVIWICFPNVKSLQYISSVVGEGAL
jgi:hypothetical protein